MMATLTSSPQTPGIVKQKSPAEVNVKNPATSRAIEGERADRRIELKVSECGPLLTTLTDIQIGMKVEAKDLYGKWYVAKVIEVEEGDQEVLVHFEKWNSRYDEYIKINSGRLRSKHPSKVELFEKDQDISKKIFLVGDLVQAKWEDGRMYFGKVLKVYKDEVDILYDDGVKFKAPVSAVRRRRLQSRSNLSRSSHNESDSSQTPNSRALRAQKRHRSDDSASQTSFSSPPSSPVFVPTKRRRIGCFESDSTDFDSDLDDSSNLYHVSSPHTHEHPLPVKKVKKNSKSKRLLSVSSDSEGPGVQGPSQKRKRSHDDLRDSYRLRHASQQSVKQSVKLSPVKEHCDSSSWIGITDKQEAPTALLTPPVDSPASTNVANVTENNILTKHEGSQPPVTDPTPPETPVSHSKSTVRTKTVVCDSTGTKSSVAHVSDSSTTKGSAVALRTRAQTKFDSVTAKKGDTKKPVKVAPKEMVIVWDHNEFKCMFTGCNKSFRKDTLLQSHIKHYHSDSVKTNKPVQKLRGTPEKEKRKKESSISPSQKLSQRSQSPPPLSESPLSPGYTQKGAKSQKHSSPKPTTATKGSKSSPKKNRENSVVVKKEKLPSLSEYLRPANSSEMALKVTPQTTVKLESKLLPQSVVTRPSHESKELTAPLTKSNKKPKPSLGNSQPTMFSVVGPPMKVPLVEIKALPRESLSFPAQVKYQTNIRTSSSLNKESELTDDLFSEEVESYNVLSHPNVCRRVLRVEGDSDVVHCVCGDLTDEGFMIQCEQCLCWQHGDCIRLSKDALPDKYVCCFCTNPPGQRNRFKYQFDRQWFGEGKLPNLPGAPKFGHSSSVKESHQLSDTIYKLKKMLHSSKVKLQAASRVNHPYLRQWAKECSHRGKVDIISYLIAALVPISYYSQRKGDSNHLGNSHGLEMDSREPFKVPESNEQRLLNISGDVPENNTYDGDGLVEAHSSGVHNGANGKHGLPLPAQNDTPINVASLRLDPLPPTTSPGHLPTVGKTTSSEGPNESSPDPKTLKLAPLPPLKTEDLQQLTTEILKKSIQLSVSKLSMSNRNTSKTVKTKDDCGSKDTVHTGESADNVAKGKLESSDVSHSQSKPKGDTHEVINDEFGVQELSVFALNSNNNSPSQINNGPSSHSRTLTSMESSSSRSAFKPVGTPTVLTSVGGPLTTAVPSTMSSMHSSNTTPLTVGPAQTIQSFTDVNSRSPRVSVIASSLSSSSTMDSVSLGEFAEAFMQGDTTNWFQRMQLLDHIENIQEKVSTWMDMLDQQLEELPVDEDDDIENIEDLLKNVQSTMTQLRQLQQVIS